VSCAAILPPAQGSPRRLENRRREQLRRARLAEVAPFFPRGIAASKQCNDLMCGICGHTSDSRRDDVARMNAAIVPRRPDDERTVTHYFSGVSLGARRLSVIDVKGGRQPVTNEDGTIWAALSGEIYTHPAQGVPGAPRRPPAGAREPRRRGLDRSPRGLAAPGRAPRSPGTASAVICRCLRSGCGWTGSGTGHLNVLSK
jgi:hypothetical protein